MNEELRAIAIRHGCAGFGVTSADEFDGVAAEMHDRNDSGFSGRRRFTFKDPDLAASPQQSFPWAKSLVVLSWSYLPEAGSPGRAMPAQGRVARFATQDHYVGLRRAVAAVAHELESDGFQTASLVDDDRLVDRAAAVRAGVAWWGKSTMVLDPKYGPWLLLGSIATDAALPTDRPMKRDCGTCDACIPACPTGAIVAPGVLDARLCLAHWLQTAGTFPRDLRVPLGDRFYGCDDCLDACPPGVKQLTDVEVGVGKVDLLEVLDADADVLLERFAHFFVPRRRPRILRRNALLALANTLASGAEPGLVERASAVAGSYLEGDDEMLRAHAAWTLGRIGGPEAVRILDARAAIERVPEVREEIHLALAGLRSGAEDQREDSQSW